GLVISAKSLKNNAKEVPCLRVSRDHLQNLAANHLRLGPLARCVVLSGRDDQVWNRGQRNAFLSRFHVSGHPSIEFSRKDALHPQENLNSSMCDSRVRAGMAAATQTQRDHGPDNRCT